VIHRSSIDRMRLGLRSWLEILAVPTMFETIAVLTTLILAVVFVGLFYMDRASRNEDSEQSRL
jgi:hypothetical protein